MAGIGGVHADMDKRIEGAGKVDICSTDSFVGHLAQMATLVPSCPSRALLPLVSRTEVS